MKIAVIGSGLAGMTFAREVAGRHDVTVFEKSRGSSGRMSTRRRESDDGTIYAFDHGAQYFTIKTAAFQERLNPLIERGIVQPWDVPMVTIAPDGTTAPRSYEAYVACPGMTALAKTIGGDIHIQHDIEIQHLNRQNNGWILTDKAHQHHGPFDKVVSAIPAAQAAQLMPDLAATAGLHQVKMMACFTVMLGFREKLNLPWGGAFITDHPLGFIAVNSTKPGREGGFSLVVQANNEWAEPRIDNDPDQIEAEMHHTLKTLTGIDSAEASLTSFHRWRYAATRTPLGKAFVTDDERSQIMIGDWCLKGRVEAAFESGLAAAKATLSEG